MDPGVESHNNRGAQCDVSTLLTMLYKIAPLLLVPLWAYHKGNWWLLTGIAVSFAGSVLAGQYSRLVLLFASYCIGFFIRNGISIDYYTTFYFLLRRVGVYNVEPG